MVTVHRALLAGLAALALLPCGAAAALGQAQPRAKAPSTAKPALEAQAFTVSRASSAITIDGVLEEEAWARATVMPIAFEYQPGDNVAPPVRTDCLITFDRERLYLAFRAFDPRPSEIRAHLMDRDAIDTFIQDDHVTVMIDTFNDERHAYQFRVNPLGVQADAVNSEFDGVEDWSWDAIWDAAGRLTPDGFIVEMAIPFRELRFPGGDKVLTFGIAAERSYPRSVRHRITTHPLDRSRGCQFCQVNKVTGFQGMAAGRNLEIDPTVTGRRTDTRDQATAPGMTKGPTLGDVGATVRWGLAAGSTLTGTVNPDFSQVEADVAQLDVNTRFALFYPEKRPFFLEGADYFTTPEQAVFTRTVADPSGGLKLVGKRGNDTVGVFVTRDRLNNLILPSNQDSAFASEDRDVTGVVARYRRDLGRTATFGMLYTDREASPYFNRVIGPDAQFRVHNSEFFTFQYLRSETQYSPQIAGQYGQAETPFAGNAIRATYDHFARSWFWGAGYADRDKGFRADSGFIPRVDIRQENGYLQRRFWGSGDAWFTTVDVAVTGARTTDHDGRLTNQTAAATVVYAGPLQSRVQANLAREKELFGGVMYEETSGELTVAVKPSGAIAVQALCRLGDGVDYANNQPARVMRIEPSIEWKVGAPLNLQFSHSLERLSVPGGWLYTANLSQFRAVYHLNRRTFLRAILQYTDVSHDPARYREPVAARATKLFSQYLFSFKLNPQTVLLAGYSDNASGGTNLSLTRTDRTFFVKVGYAWLF